MDDDPNRLVAQRIATLSDRQREVLRLVSRDHGSKEIARALGLSDETVRNHVKAAMAKLGVGSRYDAARLVRMHEGDDPRVASDPARVIAISVPPVDPGPGRGGVADAPIVVREARAAFDVDLSSGAGRAPDPRGRRLGTGEKGHGLTGVQVLGWIAVMAAALAVMGIAAAPLARSAQDIANMIESPTNDS